MFALLGLTLLLRAPIQEEIPTFPQSKIELQQNNWIEYRTKLTKMNDGAWTLTCSNPCNGKKHLVHQECDTSCDGPCTEIHKYDFEPIFYCAPGGDIKAAGQKFGLRDFTWTVLRQVSDGVYDELKHRGKKYELRHWNKTPCSKSEKKQPNVEYKVQADFQFFRNDTGPDGQKILVKGPSGTWEYGSVVVPKGELEDGETVIRCRCSVVTGEHAGAGVFIEENGKTELATAKAVETLLNIDCANMNECTVTCTNTADANCKVTIGTGTVLHCTDGSCQDEVVCEGGTFTCGGNATVHVAFPIAPSNDLAGSKFEAACLNMHKSEPRTGVKYVFEMPSKGSISQLAEQTSSEHFRGSWDQIRLWIVTDHASHADIVKILFPRPGRGTYLQSLYEVAKITGLDVTAPEYESCLDPALVVGAAATSDATDWYVRMWAAKDPKGLAAWLNQNADEFRATCFSANAKESEITHGADACNALCTSATPVLAEAGLTALEKAVPQDKRAEVAAAHGLEGALGLLDGADAKLARHALKVAELYRDSSSAHLLLNVNEALPKEIRDRCVKLYGEIHG